MAEVMNVPRQPDGQSYYESSSHRPSPSSSSLFLHHSPPSSSSSSPSLSPTSKTSDSHAAQHHDYRDSSIPPRETSSTLSHSPLPSPPSIAPSDSPLHSVASTSSTASSISTSPTWNAELELPNYDDASGGSKNSSDTPPSSPALEEALGDDNTDNDTTPSETPLPTPTVADDTAIKDEPSRQVDFLSHDWREEDIWSSWRHIVSQRKTVYGERSRLENASWRTWAKHKFDLRTVPPERLNWLKESDVTWLYGPLKTAASYPVSKTVSETGSQLSKSNSFIAKKPILKKRSMSEVMLQRSISTSSLVKQAADRIQAQGRYSRRAESHSGVVDSKLQSETPSRDQVDYLTSRSTSASSTPCEPLEKRHIRFDERVEQCIAVEAKDHGADPDYESEEDEEDHTGHHSSDSSSDEGVVMMKRSKVHGGKNKQEKVMRSRSNSISGPKTIETLPATTLKYRTDSPDITAEAQHHTFGRSWISGKLSPSPSQETLRPAHPSSNFLIPNDDEDEEDLDSDSSWSFGASNPKSSLGASSGGRDEYRVEGMRRTSSGMFMPEDEDEDDAVAQGLFGRVTETINTARDIAHVIWNVGWRSG